MKAEASVQLVVSSFIASVWAAVSELLQYIYYSVAVLKQSSDWQSDVTIRKMKMSLQIVWPCGYPLWAANTLSTRRAQWEEHPVSSVFFYFYESFPLLVRCINKPFVLRKWWQSEALPRPTVCCNTGCFCSIWPRVVCRVQTHLSSLLHSCSTKDKIIKTMITVQYFGIH